ncbi:hypothetical protein GVN18_34135 [Pseudomonas sp. ODNR1LW]|nr:hypothetical protein [Pseudomonas sp. ODNR1LW]
MTDASVLTVVDVLKKAQRALQRLARRAASDRAWRRFQATVRKQREQARADHARTREINQRQSDRLHAALRAGRQQGA